jgi:hypothetical protein
MQRKLCVHRLKVTMLHGFLFLFINISVSLILPLRDISYLVSLKVSKISKFTI